MKDSNDQPRKQNNETESHLQAKNLIANKLRDWFGVSLSEYAADGHKADDFSVTADGIEIFVEVIWGATEGNVNRDIVLIQRSNAPVKIVVVNPLILENDSLRRELDKTVISERTKKTAFVGPIDVNKILSDNQFVETEFKIYVEEAVDAARKMAASPSRPKKALIWSEDNKHTFIENFKGEGVEDTGIYIKGGESGVVRNVHLKAKPGSKSTGIYIG